MIDEIPILTILGLFTAGKMTLTGAEELRYKESDRLGALIAFLNQLDVQLTSTEDGFDFCGDPQFQFPSQIDMTIFQTYHDHRLVMSLEVLNLRKTGQPLQIEGKEWVKISYPSFYDHLSQLLQTD